MSKKINLFAYSNSFSCYIDINKFGELIFKDKSNDIKNLIIKTNTNLCHIPNPKEFISEKYKNPEELKIIRNLVWRDNENNLKNRKYHLSLDKFNKIKSLIKIKGTRDIIIHFFYNILKGKKMLDGVSYSIYKESKNDFINSKINKITTLDNETIIKIEKYLDFILERNEIKEIINNYFMEMNDLYENYL